MRYTVVSRANVLRFLLMVFTPVSPMIAVSRECNIIQERRHEKNVSMLQIMITQDK